MTPLIFLDTETTGLRPDIHAPWEVAWVTARHDVERKLLIVQRRFQCFVIRSTRIIAGADPFALEIGRFEERYDESATVTYHELVRELRLDTEAIAHGTDEKVPHLVGAVPSFDHNMLCVNWLGWPGFSEGLWHYHLVDVEVLAAGALGVAPPYKSDELAAQFRIVANEDTKHTAAGDVDWTMQLYAAIYNLEII